jgi:hypothetical protein
MKFIVTRAFRDVDGVVKMPGDTVALEAGRAALLRSNGVVGGPARETAEAVPKNVETADVKPAEIRRKK